jgi:cobalt-zinc-cadmium resistance protein CzcA
MGRPDDGTDVTTFNNVEFMVALKSPSEWPSGLTKDKLVAQMDAELEKFPGVDFNFSQNIEDNVEEAMSGVKGENSLKLFGDDIDVLVEKAGEIKRRDGRRTRRGRLSRISGDGPARIADLHRSRGERALRIDGVGCRFSAVQAAIGGIAATQILEGDRRFDFVIRYQPEFRTHAGGHSQHPASHLERGQRSPGPSRGSLAA